MPASRTADQMASISGPHRSPGWPARLRRAGVLAVRIRSDPDVGRSERVT